jgi:hypothetical protein
MIALKLFEKHRFAGAARPVDQQAGHAYTWRRLKKLLQPQ